MRGKLCIWKNFIKTLLQSMQDFDWFVSYGTHQCFQKFVENCRKGAGNFVHDFSSYYVRRLISVITQQVTCCCTKHMPIGAIWSLQSYAHCMTPSQLTCEQAPKPSWAKNENRWAKRAERGLGEKKWRERLFCVLMRPRYSPPGGWAHGLSYC